MDIYKCVTTKYIDTTTYAIFSYVTQLVITCSKLTIGTVEQGLHLNLFIIHLINLFLNIITVEKSAQLAPQRRVKIKI